MAKKHFSLFLQVLTICLSLILAISAVLLLLFAGQTNGMIEQNLTLNAEATMRYMEADIRNVLAPAADLTILAASAIPGIPSRNQLAGIFRDMLVPVPTAFEMFYGTARSRFNGGYFVTATGWDPYADDPEWDQIKRPWFIFSMVNPGEAVVTEPYEDSQTGKMCVTIVRTVEDTNGATAGVVGVNIFLEIFGSIITSRRITADGNTFLIDKDGLYIAHENPAMVLQQNFFDEEKNISKDIILKPEGSVTIKGSRYWASSPVGRTEWYMVSQGSTAEFFSGLTRFLRFALILIMIMLAAGVALAVLFARIITHPFTDMIEIFHVIAGGDLTVTVPDYTTREASALSAAFNDFAVNIKAAFNSFNQNAAMVSTSVYDLSASAKEITTTANEQSASVAEIVSTMENSKNLSEQVAAKTVEVANLASRTQELSLRGAELRDANQDMMQDIKDQNDKIIEEIKNLADMLSRIDESVQLIDTIADQTKLIAFNAALEASSSGEAGSRFAVVASEIRRFADNVVESVVEIKEKITGLQEASQALISEANNGSRAIDNGYTRMVEQKEVFENIVDISQNVATRSQQISNLSKQQELASAQIFTALKEISAGVKQFVTATASTSATADNLNSMSVELKETLAKYNGGNK